MTPCRAGGLHARALGPMWRVVKAPPDSVLRYLYLGLGWLLVVLAPVVGALPGPGGIFIFAGGAALLLKNSHWVKRLYVRYTRRYPGHGRLADKVLRRPQAPRGRPRPSPVAGEGEGVTSKARALVDFFSRRP